jgi:hypothetical protein
MAGLSLALVLAAASIGPRHFDVDASFVAPARPGGSGAIAVRFAPKDPDVHINEEPPPRLTLDLEQSTLVDKQAPPSKAAPVFDPATARYLDAAKPVRFPVAFARKAAKGPQTVKASVVYFYCSEREGWCRRGTSELEIAVTVP